MCDLGAGLGKVSFELRGGALGVDSVLYIGFILLGLVFLSC